MSNDAAPVIVTADWLQQRLGQPGLSIIDGSWYLPAQNRDPKAEYAEAHIPGAVFFDQDLVVEPGVDLPHALPSPLEFQAVDDEPVQIVVLLLMPRNRFDRHIKTLASIARMFNDESFRKKILAAPDAESINLLIEESTAG